MSSSDVDAAVCAAERTTTSGSASTQIPVEPDQYGHIVGESSLNRARDDSFLMVLDLPCFIKKLNLSAKESSRKYPLDRLEMNVFKANIPTINAPSHPVPFGQGGTLKYPGSRIEEYTPIDIQYVIDARYRNYKLLHRWINKIPDNGDNEPSVPSNDVMATFALYALNEYKQPVVRFLFKDAFPTSLGGFDMATRNQGDDIIGSVTFEYNFFEVKLIDPESSNIEFKK
jgi:hypothetical protein